MPKFDLVIRGGSVVTEDGIASCDVGIIGEKIAALGSDLEAAREERDATGHFVLPGGIDTHAHIEQPMGGGVVNADTFDSGTASALAGGTTSVICFAAQQKGRSLMEAVEAYKQAASRSRIDYGFHISVNEPTEDVLTKDIPALVAEGHRSIKVFMTYDAQRLRDEQILDVLAAARRNGAMVCVHAENHDLIAFITRRLLEAGLSSPKYHPWSKPMVVEREATHRIIAFAEAFDVPIQVFHVSGSESAEEIARAKRKGLKVWGETCPQYLLFTAQDLDRPGLEGAKVMFSPAPRERADQEDLWRRLSDGTLDVVSSDHSPTRFDDPHGKKVAGENAAFNRIPNGVPGLAARMSLLFSEGVVKKRIDLATFVRLTSTNAARIFGLYPRKGVIAVGSDADLVIWDGMLKRTLSNAMMHHGSDYSPYEGMTVQGAPVATYSRGQLAFNGSDVLLPPGSGRMLRREPYEEIRPRGAFPTPFNPVDAIVLDERP